MYSGNTVSYLAFNSKPVYVNDSLHWLRRTDGSVVAFDTKREHVKITNSPEFISCHDSKSIVIANYDYVSSNWRVSHTLDNFITVVDGYNYGFPIWIDGKQTYDSEINGYKIAATPKKDNVISRYLCSFEPTLASVHKTLSDTIRAKHMTAIIAMLDQLKQFITEATKESTELIKNSFGGLRHLVLEAVTFGSFLWDVESYVDSRYHFLGGLID
ncbi:uncharacterized protein LOC142182133 [Nicotiana tabacum]|uniref:Uncharacterized protein LOC142182133 n=1 Tax=Nicotiana tabacum TaxID=4097 RepID=A0AC58URT6_TOBAC